MKIALGADHAGFDVKDDVKSYLESKGHEVFDKGTFSNDSVDYPKFGHDVGMAVSNNDVDKGIVICGSGIGISIAANKINGVRAALCTSSDHAKMSRLHNDANVLALGARMTDYDVLIKIIDTWLSTDFEGGRHQQRVEKIEVS